MTEGKQQVQVPELILTDPEAANALEDTVFLGESVFPASPSDVGRALGMPANVVHHHVRKFVRLGLLFEVGRDKGKVLYQLTALSFKVPRDLSWAVQSGGDTVFERGVRRVTEQLLEACRRSSSRIPLSDDQFSIFTFNSERQLPLVPEKEFSPEARPAYYIERTLKLTPERYQALLAQIDLLIQQEASTWADPRAESCTVSALAFEGPAKDGLKEGMTLSSYMNLHGEEPA